MFTSGKSESGPGNAGALCCCEGFEWLEWLDACENWDDGREGGLIICPNGCVDDGRPIGIGCVDEGRVDEGRVEEGRVDDGRVDGGRILWLEGDNGVPVLMRKDGRLSPWLVIEVDLLICGFPC